MYQTYRHPSGLRIICARNESEVAYGGIAVDAGTRDELPGEDGMAHFVEHLSFKGTSRRTSRQIITRMESVGGDLNAFTGKEETVYYCTTLRQHLSRAIELLLDITLNSIFPPHEIEREVEVVIDEIESYNDQPSELIYDDFESLLFPDHSLGRNILGSPERLRQFRSADMQGFVRRLYHPERMVLFVYGRVEIDEVVRMVERISLPASASQPFALGSRKGTLPSPQELGRRLTVSHSTHQAHVMMGCRTFKATDPRHYALYLLNNLLGGPAMSSRLNTSLRERHGLVYSVESSMVSYTDAGLWCVYFGCDHHDVARCEQLVRHELKRLLDAPLSQRTLDAMRRQLKGQIGIAYDNSESVAIGMAKRFLHYGTTQTMQQQFARLDALTPDLLWQTAKELFTAERLFTLAFTDPA